MKDSVKYFISTIIFFVIYVLTQWLFMSRIDWRVTILATILYGITNTLCHELLVKKIK